MAHHYKPGLRIKSRITEVLPNISLSSMAVFASKITLNLVLRHMCPEDTAVS